MTPRRETPDIETSSDRYAARFSNRSGAYLLAAQRLAVNAVLPKQLIGNALDVGGGHGQITPILTARGYSVTVLGSSPECFHGFSPASPSVRQHFVAGNLLALPFSEQSFDLVVAVRLLAHMHNWRRLVAELCRVARTSLVIEFPNRVSINALSPLFLPVKRRWEADTRPYRTFHPQQVVAALRSNGFQVSARHNQLTLPLSLHRRLNSPAALQLAERLLRAAGVTRVWGSPTLLRADRR